ncbi:DUF6516 family protein [uncultured Psychrobacillus sp.]|uniref:toxin-antitoxin system TumE family protein n=1 Tax=uncultured Psychrobacillus sp. TaxID=1551585 RepID=UPI0026148A4C|nr:DUF6516 family protein [uncultured Psychrobacillus sp.]
MSRQKQIDRVQFFGDLFVANPQLFNHNKIPEIKAKGEERVVATLPLNNHDIYGETVLFINEKYNKFGDIEEYRYAWEYPNIKGKYKKSKHERHITSFDKQWHPEPPRNVDTDPYHHHNEPGDTVPRTETSIEKLEDFLPILVDYINSHKQFIPSHTFYDADL